MISPRFNLGNKKVISVVYQEHVWLKGSLKETYKRFLWDSHMTPPGFFNYFVTLGRRSHGSRKFCYLFHIFFFTQQGLFLYKENIYTTYLLRLILEIFIFRICLTVIYMILCIHIYTHIRTPIQTHAYTHFLDMRILEIMSMIIESVVTCKPNWFL